MARLSASQRKRSATVAPSQGHPSGRFPMPDKAHARLALAMVNRAHGLSALQKAAIIARAKRILGQR